MLPLAWELWEKARRDARRVLRNWFDWMALTAIPAALLAWMVYRGIGLGDLSPDFESFHHLIYSVLISPGAFKFARDQAFLWPWQSIALASEKIRTAPELSDGVDLMLGLFPSIDGYGLARNASQLPHLFSFHCID